MDRLGRRLREAREAKGSTLEEAEAATHIRTHFLESLEAGDFASFAGGDVQVRGFLRIYARYLDLSPEDVLGRYSAEVHGEDYAAAEAEEKKIESENINPPDDLTSIRFRPRDIPVTSSLPRWMSVKTVIIVGLILTALLGILALATYLMNRPGDEALFAQLTSTATVPARVTHTSMVTSTLAEPTPTFPVSTNGDISLTLEATEHVQVRVRRGDEVVFQGLMKPGQAESWSDDEMLVVETGNGAALKVTVNGTMLGRMGDRGEFCSRAWSPSGEVASQ